VHCYVYCWYVFVAKIISEVKFFILDSYRPDNPYLREQNKFGKRSSMLFQTIVGIIVMTTMVVVLVMAVSVVTLCFHLHTPYRINHQNEPPPPNLFGCKFEKPSSFPERCSASLAGGSVPHGAALTSQNKPIFRDTVVTVSNVELKTL
jgi:hypothetical protein